jgi:SAM-dependent methyltransferase
LDSHSQAARKLAEEYSANADRYALRWAPVLEPMRRTLLSRLPLGSARYILDLGCGTGDLFVPLHREAPQAQLVGCDRAVGMLQVARQATPGAFVAADAASLPLRSESFDVVIVAFALFHMPDPIRSLREACRVLRPKGMFGVTVWGFDPGMPGAAIWTEELDARGAAPDPRDAIVMGQTRMNTTDKLAALLEQTDLVGSRLWSEWFEHRWTIDALLELQTACGMPARRLASLPQDLQHDCCQRVRARIAELPIDALGYRPEVLFATATRPE